MNFFKRLSLYNKLDQYNYSRTFLNDTIKRIILYTYLNARIIQLNLNINLFIITGILWADNHNIQ